MCSGCWKKKPIDYAPWEAPRQLSTSDENQTAEELVQGPRKEPSLHTEEPFENPPTLCVIHLFSKCLMCIYYVPVTDLGTEDTAVNKNN